MKPNITIVFEIFQWFTLEQQRIATQFPVAKWKSRFKLLREDFKNKLNEVGLAEHIDWSEPQ
jgi:hypothetical protein